MIYKNFKKFMIVPIAILVIAIVVACIFGGLNVGIDFTGGSIITVSLGEFETEDIKAVLADLGETDTSVVKSGKEAIIRVRYMGSDDAQNEFTNKLMDSLKAKYQGATLEGKDAVGGIASGELVRNAFLSVLLACILMLIYIWIRFELFSGISAVLALLHDVLIMIAFVCIFRIQINSSFIAACLTIVGYSINNTIIVFDRVRENRRRYSVKEMDNGAVANMSIKETLPRTINTTITTLIMIVCLYILGVESIKEFALPIIIGLIAGLYSSVFLSASMWMKFDAKFGKKRKKGKVKAIS